MTTTTQRYFHVIPNESIGGPAAKVRAAQASAAGASPAPAATARRLGAGAITAIVLGGVVVLGGLSTAAVFVLPTLIGA